MRAEIEQMIRKEFIINARTSVYNAKSCCLYKTLVSDRNGSWQKHGERALIQAHTVKSR